MLAAPTRRVFAAPAIRSSFAGALRFSSSNVITPGSAVTAYSSSEPIVKYTEDHEWIALHWWWYCFHWNYKVRRWCSGWCYLHWAPQPRWCCWEGWINSVRWVRQVCLWDLLPRVLRNCRGQQGLGRIRCIDRTRTPRVTLGLPRSRSLRRMRLMSSWTWKPTRNLLLATKGPCKKNHYYYYYYCSHWNVFLFVCLIIVTFHSNCNFHWVTRVQSAHQLNPAYALSRAMKKSGETYQAVTMNTLW